MDHEAAERFAREWYAAWNAHDLDRILSHYADDVEMASPLVSLMCANGQAAAEVVFLDEDARIARYLAHYTEHGD